MQTRYAQALVLACAFTAHASFASAQSWVQTFGGPVADRVESVALAQGGLFAAGTSFSFGSGASSGWIARVRRDGAADWEAAIGGAGTDQFLSVAAAPDGGCVAAGFTTSSGAGGQDAWVVKFDGRGAVQWQRTYGSAGDESFTKIVPASAGFYVAGTAGSVSAQGEAWALELDATGAVVWEKTLGGKGDDMVSALAATPAGLILAVSSNSPLGGPAVPFFRPWLVALDPDGNVTAQKTFNLTGGDVLADVQPLSTGGYVATGELAATSFQRGNLWVLKLDEELDLVWEKAYGDNLGILFVDAGRCIRETPAGGLFVAGYTGTAGAGSEDLWVLHLDGAGHGIANRTIGGTGYDNGLAMELDPGGGVFLGGFAQYPPEGGPLKGLVARVDAGFGAVCRSSQAVALNVGSGGLMVDTPTVAAADGVSVTGPGAGVLTPLSTGVFVCQ